MKRVIARGAALSALLVAGAAVPTAASAEGQLFGEATNYRVTQWGVSPTAEAIAPGDFNEDGFADIAMTDQFKGGAILLLGDGTGSLGAPAFFATGIGADALSADDLDADGNLDLVVANAVAGNVSVLYGNGAGGFTKGGDHPVQQGAGAIAIRDFDQNGHLDFAVAAAPSKLFLGQGNRQFTAQDLGAGLSVVGLDAGDVNGDGLLDIVVGDGWPARLYVLLGNGNGGFSAPASYAVPGWVMEAFRVADLDGDGLDDVVAVNSEGPATVFLAGPGGVLGTPAAFDAGWGADGLEIADLNGDDKPDVAINTAGDSMLSIWLGDGTGRFTKNESHSVVRSAESVAVVDLNGDGMPDLVAAPFTAPDISVLIHA